MEQVNAGAHRKQNGGQQPGIPAEPFVEKQEQGCRQHQVNPQIDPGEKRILDQEQNARVILIDAPEAHLHGMVNRHGPTDFLARSGEYAQIGAIGFRSSTALRSGIPSRS